jgi:predicted YcjX-like family ATPase
MLTTTANPSRIPDFMLHKQLHGAALTQQDKQAALRYILEAWEEAVYDGLDPDCIATAAIFAALSDMIASYGEEPVAVMCERLPERIRSGEFTVMKTKQ